MIPFLSFEYTNNQIRSEIFESFESVFNEGWYILGKQTEQFELEYASFNRVNYAIGVSNGLDALHIALKALNIGKGDEVLVPSNTFIATVLAVSFTGATPVFVEPDLITYNLNPFLIEASLTSKTKAIIPVHLYGQACNMDEIQRIARSNEILILEDNAQAQGASWNGQLTGSWGHINATSFYPGKNLGAMGDAGAITTNDPILAKQVRMFRNYGSIEKYEHEVIGYNQRMDEMQAAFLRIKLRYLPEWTKQRQAIALLYDNLLKGVGDIITPKVSYGASHVYHLYVIRTQRRDALKEFLLHKGIGTLIHYPIPVHLQKAYSHLNYRKGDFPVAEELANTCLSLPIWPGMTELMVQTVSNAIKLFFKE